MDELEISGKRYLSSKRAAKEHRYHIDYIGQLIRAGKVTGKKVGRSWYVEEVSLRTYLKQEAGEKGLPPVIEVEEVAVAPVVEEAIEEVEPEPVEEVVVAEEKIIEPVYVVPAVTAHIPKKEVEQEERKVFFSVPEKVVPKPSTLTYIADDEPMLPALEGRSRSNADFVAIPMRRVTEEQIYEEPVVTIEEMPMRKATYARKSLVLPRMQVITVLGVIVLALVAVASSMLASSIKVVDGQPASAGYVIK